MLSADCEMKPSPRHSKYGRSSNTVSIARSAGGFPSHGTIRLYWFSTFASPAWS
jgi:hypothetical protein